MKISSATKISTLLKANSASLETIASINKHFEKLRNPILRKVLAPRVTIADAARMGNCSVNVFFEKLKTIGFEIEYSVPEEIYADQKTAIPEFVLNSNETNSQRLDVRTEISNGRDPFALIMDVLDKLPINNTLILINSFEPIPLINILKKKGFVHFVQNQEDGVVLTFLKKTTDSKSNFTLTSADESSEFLQIAKQFSDKLKFVDVRNLEMPLPMTSILSELENLPSNFALFVYHKKIPQFLFPELQERNFKWVINEIRDGEVNLIIYK